jgi:hypothetical protein
MVSISNIKAQLTQGGARPTLFRCFLINPINPNADSKFEFMCKTSQIPTTTLGVIEVPYMGRKYKIAGDRTYPEWTCTIMNDEDFAIRHALEQWSNAINGFISNTRNSGATSAPSSYLSDGFIEQLSKEGRVLRRYRMLGCFPQELGTIDVSWESNDAIEEYSVTFQYSEWVVDGGTTGSSSSGLGNITVSGDIGGFFGGSVNINI